MKFFLRISLRNLRRNTKRNLATGSAIAFGFAGILLLGGYANRVNSYLKTYTIFVVHTGHIALFAKDGFQNFSFKPKQYSLTKEDQSAIETILKSHPNVEFFERQLQGTGLVGNGCLSLPFIAKGIEPQIDKTLREHVEVRRWMAEFKPFLKGRGLWNFPDGDQAVLLSSRLARGLGKHNVHDEFKENKLTPVNCESESAREDFAKDANVQFLAGTWSGSMGALDGEVVAHFTTGVDETDNSAVISPLTSLQKLYDTENVSQYSIWLKDAKKLSETTSEIQALLKSEGKTFDLMPWNNDQLSPYYSGTIQFLYSLVAFIAIVMGVIISFSVLNSTTMTVIERTNEIGSYRSLGFRKSHIRWLFILESMWLTFISLVVGGVLGAISIYTINSAKILYHPPGASEGITLQLVLSGSFVSLTAVIILLLSGLTTWFTAMERLRIGIANLMSGVAR